MKLNSVSSSIQIAASIIGEKTDAKWVVSVTQSGHSCLKMSRFRSQKRVLGITNSIKVMRKMALYWGITPFYFEEKEGDIISIQDQMIGVLKDKKLVQNGDKIVITHGDGKFFKHGTSNSLRVEIIKDVPREDKNFKSSDKFQEVSIDNGRILLDSSLCASCQICVSTCPHGIWQVTKDSKHDTEINKELAHLCTKDMECVEKCPTGAIEIIDTDL